MNGRLVKSRVHCLAFLTLIWLAAGPLGLARAQMDTSPTVMTNREIMVKKDVTIWDLARSGGFVLVILVLMSVGGIALIIHNFMTLRVEHMAPIQFAEKVVESLEDGDEKKVRQLCSANDNIFSNIVISGLAKKNRGPVFAREAMENMARQEISAIWQKISYLSDLGTIAPLVGLLGTVLGMLQAFSVIAIQTISVKPVMLVAGVSKAMVATAGGLVVAIPSLLAYSYFKGRVISITSVVESYTAELVKIMEEVTFRVR